MKNQQIQNPGREGAGTKRLVVLALFAAISIALTYLIRFPIFPAAPFLEYDPADITVIITSFVYGPVYGLALTFVVSALQALTVSAHSGIIGFFMHFLATGALALVVGFTYRRTPSLKQSVISLCLGIAAMTLVMIPLNLVFTPMYGTPLQVVKDLMFPVIVPFNLIKASVNALVAGLLYRRVGKLISPGDPL